MSTLLTTAALVRMLQEQDPEGTRVVQVRVLDYPSETDVVVCADLTVSDVEISLRGGQQTFDGDRDVLRVTLRTDGY